jgi:hypothetical protein
MAKYVFDPEVLQEVANCGAGLPIGQRWTVIHQELSRRYPGKVYPRLRWVFNSSGNLVCQLALVYASPVEYVAFFGTPIGAAGFSGRYPWSDVWDLMVAGRMLTCRAGEFEPTVFCAGDPAFLKRGEGKSIAYVGSTWMIDYARGLPITMLPYGVLAPASFVTLDLQAALAQLGQYGQLVLWNWRRRQTV